MILQLVTLCIKHFFCFLFKNSNKTTIENWGPVKLLPAKKLFPSRIDVNVRSFLVLLIFYRIGRPKFYACEYADRCDSAVCNDRDTVPSNLDPLNSFGRESVNQTDTMV